MTMVAGYHSEEGIVLISDSRVTWGAEKDQHFQDSLQKIVPLADGLVLAFAGDVRAVERIIRELRSRIAKKTQLRVARKLAAEVPRIAKHFFSLHKSQVSSTSGVDIMVAGRETGGKTGLWVFQSPNFSAQHITDGIVIIGSGQVAGELLGSSMPPIPERPTLKERSDALMLGLESALQKKGVQTVGGMFQVLTISPADGIRPMMHGYIDVDPDSPPSAKWMTIAKGKWTQEDLTTGRKTSLVEPAQLTTPESQRIVDYEVDKSKRPKWHVTRFIICQGYGTAVQKTIFKRPATIFSGEKFPLEGELLVVVGFWGTAGEHALKISLKIGETETILESGKFHNDFLPEEVEFVSKVRFKVEYPTAAFFEVHIDDQLLARRAVRFGLLDEPIPGDPAKLKEFAARQDVRAKAEQQADTDPSLVENLRAGLAYFVLCQEVRHGDDLEFEQEFKAAYWKSYPLLLKCNIALAFRVSLGEHQLKLTLVDAATRTEWPIDTGKCVSTSPCLTTTFEGTVIIKVPKSGLYFVNAILDGQRLGTKLLAAETTKAKFSYSLRDEDAARVEAGELLLLAVRSQQLKKAA